MEFTSSINRSASEPAPAVRKLSDWILSRSPEGLTHLKLQKLVFYCYSAAVAHGLEAQIGAIELEAWEHGPVSRTLWDEYRGCAAEPIHYQGQHDGNGGQVAPQYSEELEKVLTDVITGVWRTRRVVTA